ncbi:MAG TPA: S8 family peptidase [Candidatus Acidoferrum sp.]|nr:S8 family peptidase [Candidatus Acidoferrum sp.]
MPEQKLIKELDPQLRRLLASSRPSRSAVRGIFISEETAPTISAVRRVLVSLAPDIVPESFRQYEWSLVVAGIYTVAIPANRLAELAALPQVKFIESGRPMRPALDSSLPAAHVDSLHQGRNLPAGLKGSGVVVGIVDLGLDFTLADFRKPDGSTRVAYLWDQYLKPDPTTSEHAPSGRSYGVEYNAADIDRALAAPNPFSIVRHNPAAASHGTHVTGIAAGNGSSADATYPAGQYVGVAPEATIIFVQPDHGGGQSFTDSSNVADAVSYIFEKARELQMPCVVNLSLGQNGGSHDGESTVERAIDRLLEVPGTALVVAAGNEQPFMGHASGVLSVGSTRAIEWEFGTVLLGLDDTTPNELEIWYSSRDRFRARLTDPQGFVTPWLDVNGTYHQVTPRGDVIFMDSERFAVLNGDARIFISVGDNTQQALSSGTWIVELQAVEVRNGRYDVWIERDVRDASRGFADQSKFAPAHFDRVMTISTPATSRRAIAVANYDHRAGTIFRSSSRGGTRDGRSKPEVSAPGVRIVSSYALGGRPIPGQTASYPMRVQMTGTSMSAPHVTGIVALLLERNPALTSEQVRKILIASADSMIERPGFDEAWGYGAVNAERAVAVQS